MELMFLGHFALGFAAKAAAPRTSLGTLFAATQFADLLWPTFLLAGWERVRIDLGATVVTPLDFISYPYSHSLAAAVLWALVFGGVYYAIRRYRRGALVVAAGVASHWLLDAIVHRPDLPLYPGSATRIGFGLWNSLAATLAVEGVLFALCVYVYLAVTRARDRTGSLALWGLIAFLLLIYFGNLFGPPPPSVTMIAWAGQAQWLLVLWGAWADRHRMPADVAPAIPG